MSNALVEGLDFRGVAPRREEHLVDEAKEALIIDESIEGVKGVFAPERVRVESFSMSVRAAGPGAWLYNHLVLH